MPKVLCNICSSTTEQTKIILFNLNKSLFKLSLEYIPDFKKEIEKTIKSKDSFSRLLSIIFEGSSTNDLAFSKCGHEKFSRYLKRKVKCDSKTFAEICEQQIQKLGEKNYHLEILEVQIGCIEETSKKIAAENATRTSLPLGEIKHEHMEQEDVYEMQQRIGNQLKSSGNLQNNHQLGSNNNQKKQTEKLEKQPVQESLPFYSFVPGGMQLPHMSYFPPMMNLNYFGFQSSADGQSKTGRKPQQSEDKSN